MIELLLLLCAIVLVLACSIFVAAEFAFVTVDKARIERQAKAGDKQAQGVLVALQSLSTQLSGAQIGITLTNLAIGFLAEPSISALLRPVLSLFLSDALLTTVSVLLGIILATILTMLIGELVPKNIAIAKPVETAKRVQNIQRRFTQFVGVPIVIMNKVANTIVRSFNIEPQEELASARSVEELLSVVKHSAKRGTLEQDTAVLVERSLAFSERHASDVMTPRVRLEVVDCQDSLSQVINTIRQSGFSRFPVIDEEIDNVVGIIHVRDLVAVDHAKRAKTLVKQVMHDVTFIPSSIELDTLIEKMRDEGIEAVITIDEFGGIDGMVTIEDLVEELVGEVKDEHDESKAAIQQLDKDVWLVSGLLRQDEVAQVTGIMLPEDEEFETIGGLVMDQLEELPEVNDVVRVLAVNRSGQRVTARMRVTAMDGRRIDRIELQVEKVTS